MTWTAAPRKQDERHIFLVIAGAGLDAEMVAGADERLKRRLGWIAYFFAALKHLGSRRMTVSVSVDGSDEVTTQMRTVLFANVGKLPGGLMLVPDASAEDGWMDVATLDARAGIVGWTELFGNVVAQGAGVRVPDVLKAYGTSRIDHARGKIDRGHDGPHVQGPGRRRRTGLARSVTANRRSRRARGQARGRAVTVRATTARRVGGPPPMHARRQKSSSPVPVASGVTWPWAAG